jgi:hypothetical protein
VAGNEPPLLATLRDNTRAARVEPPDRQGFIELARGNVSDRVRIESDADALDRMQRVFSLEETTYS